MTTASIRRRAQAAGPQRFQAPVHSARPPVWRSLLSGLVLAAVIIGLPAALLATVGPPPLPTGVDVSVLFTQAVSFDVVVGVLIWVLYLAWLQFTVCALVEAASAIKGHGVPGHVPLSGGMQSLVRRLIASVLLLGAVSGPVAAAAAPVVEEPTPAVAVSQDVSSQQPAADDSQADGAATASQGADSDHQYMRYMVNGVELDQEIGAQLVGQRVYIVQPPEGLYHDNLWDIAERNLGEGRAYSQIYDLNAGRAQPDGGSLELARLIQPGWLLVMPESATSVARVEAIPTTPAPAPAAPTPAPTSPQPATKPTSRTVRSPYRAAEEALMRYIVLHGEETLYDYTDEESGEHVVIHIAEYILSELQRDGISLSVPIFQSMLDEAVTHLSEPGFRAESHFLSHPDAEISRVTMYLMDDRYRTIEEEPDDNNRMTDDERQEIARKRLKELEKAIVHDLFALKGAYLLQRISAINSRIKELQTEGRLDEAIELMKEQKQLNEIKVALSRELGDRIILKM